VVGCNSRHERSRLPQREKEKKIRIERRYATTSFRSSCFFSSMPLIAVCRRTSLGALQSKKGSGNEERCRCSLFNRAHSTPPTAVALSPLTLDVDRSFLVEEAARATSRAFDEDGLFFCFFRRKSPRPSQIASSFLLLLFPPLPLLETMHINHPRGVDQQLSSPPLAGQKQTEEGGSLNDARPHRNSPCPSSLLLPTSQSSSSSSSSSSLSTTAAATVNSR
jgi:hypothetical protein